MEPRCGVPCLSAARHCFLMQRRYESWKREAVLAVAKQKAKYVNSHFWRAPEGKRLLQFCHLQGSHCYITSTSSKSCNQSFCMRGQEYKHFSSFLERSLLLKQRPGEDWMSADHMSYSLSESWSWNNKTALIIELTTIESFLKRQKSIKITNEGA